MQIATQVATSSKKKFYTESYSFATEWPKKLLSEKSYKTSKGESKGYLTGIVYMMPYKFAGIGNVCVMASDGCIEGCLSTSGFLGFNKNQQAMARKTRMFYKAKGLYFDTLVSDIRALIRKANREGMTPAVRLNGTSDIGYEKISLVVDGVKYRSIYDVFPDTQFYDYSKVIYRLRRPLPANYDITFSRSEANDEHCREALARGFNVCAVFGVKKGDPLPATFMGRPVVDADETDLRFLDPRGSVVGVRAKKDAKGDDSGFVVRV